MDQSGIIGGFRNGGPARLDMKDFKVFLRVCMYAPLTPDEFALCYGDNRQGQNPQ